MMKTVFTFTGRLAAVAALATCALLPGSPAAAEQRDDLDVAASAPNEEAAWPKAIEDNSFFIEEAYNQEKGVVQHIQTLVRVRRPGQPVDYGFTQEWPVNGQRHQLSYTLPFAWRTAARGAGDLTLNYRYQLRDGHPGTALAPRVSLLVPTGSAGPEIGAGRTGLQLNLPLSRRLSRGLVVHANAGATRVLRWGLPDLRGYNLGASAIALVSPRLNLMLETTTSWFESGDAVRAMARETVLSPGLRVAFDVGRVQVVPGLALPLTHAGGAVRPGVFVYLSLEHALKAEHGSESR
jgi:hypothetical protein